MKTPGNRGLAIPAVIGHRGAAAHAPENTLASLRMAKGLGCSWVEFDVRLTADGAPVLCHDAGLERTTNGAGRVCEQSLAQIRQYDAGAWFGTGFAGERVPLLEEALRLAAALGLGANIELKAEAGAEYATAAAVSDVLRRLGTCLPMVLVSSFQPWCIEAMRALCPEVPRGILFRLVPRNWAAVARRLDCVLIGADYRRLTPRRIAAIRDSGYRLAAFTVNEPARARRLRGLGVTSIFSDIPDVIFNGSARRLAAQGFAAAPPGRAALRQGAAR